MIYREFLCFVFNVLCFICVKSSKEITERTSVKSLFMSTATKNVD